MKIYRKIIACFLALAIAVSLTVPAFAVDVGTVIDGVGTIVSVFDFARNLYKDYYDADGNPLSGASAGWTQGGTFGGGAGRDSYTDYVTGLETSLGTSTVGNSCFYLGNWSADASCLSYPAGIVFTSGSSFLYSWSGTSASFGSSKSATATFVAPVTGSYIFTAYINGSGSISGTGSPNYCEFYTSYSGLKNSSGTVINSFSDNAKTEFSYSKIKSITCSLTAGETYTYFLAPYVNFFAPGSFFVSGAVRVEYPTGVDTSLPSQTDTRTGSLAGNFGYYGDDGNLIAAENVHIVNETDNSVFNPVTNTITNFTDWTYDYSTRTYTVTLDTGTKQYITYGDENVTIKEGDTIYNIYYVTDGSGGGGGGGTDPDEPGKESIWDKLGGLLGSVGTIIVTVIESAFMKVLDALTSLVDAINAKLKTVLDAIFGLFDRVPQLFGGFTAFLTAVFPFLPQEIFDILILGAALVALIWIIKAVRGR